MDTSLPLDSPAPRPRVLPPDERRCQGQGKDGERCKAYAVRGQELCAGHAGLGVAGDPAMASLGGQAKARAAEDREHVAQEARKSVKQRLSALAERLVRDMESAYRAAIQTGSQDDLRRAQAAEYLLSRVYGKPAQPTRDETPTVSSSLAELEALSLDELAALARDLPAPPRSA